ncbi:hypothetical protein PAXRUDRAFT_20910 [Paxillus rubicundulus Ve08.2h10]|uniref:Uncharacterized protein n=1 Tax=Paxillus rubicundulus Ve08.2h10 TaxID=930991 RepID=A0A0D0BPD1_9AGAM|nr:hypothetical protein PAXRUDRAFT_20910 [Paxillus rubicundulus Ve08.2h10]
MQISTQRSDYISGKYLPQGAKLWEPSKLHKKEVISLLEFWRDRQRSDLVNVFTFRKWRDATGSLQDPVEVDSDEEGASQRRTTAPDHQLTDTEESEDDQGGPTNEEEPSDVSREPGAGSKLLDMGKQARGRGLDDEGSEEEEANGRRRTQSEVVCNPKDSGMQQARNKVQEKKSNGKDGQEAPKLIMQPRPGRSCWDSSALPKSRQVGSEGSGVNSDMAGGSTHRTEDRPTGKGKRQVAGAKAGPSKTSGTKGRNAKRVPQESQERSDNGSDKQQRRPKQTRRAPT